MKKAYFLPLAALLASCGVAPSSSSSSQLISSQEETSTSYAEKNEITVTDCIGRQVSICPEELNRVVCIGAGALRLYSYVGDVDKLCGVEDIDNISLSQRPKMFDGAPRPYLLANEEVFQKLPSCGVGGPNAQVAEAEKISACKPDIIVSEYEDVDKANALQEQVGVPVITLKYGEGGVLKDTFYQALTLLGQVFGQEERAKDLIDFYKEENKAISTRTESIGEENRPGVYICGLGNYGTTNAYMTAQNYDPMNTAHIRNVVTGLPKNGVQAIDAEKFLSLAPEMDVMIFDCASVANIRKDGTYDFSHCKAFQTGEVYLQMPYNAYYTNPETALINTWFMAKSVYPENFKDIDIEAKANEITKKFNGIELYDSIKNSAKAYGGYQKIANPTSFFQAA